MVVPIKKVSPSSLGTYEFCPMKYFIGNILNIREGANVKAEMGSICHVIFQIVALSKLGNQNGEKLTKESVYGQYTTEYDKIDTDELIRTVHNRYVSKRPYLKWPTDSLEQVIDWSYKVLNTSDDPRNFEIVSVEDKFKFEIEEEWAKYNFLLPNGEFESGNLVINGIIDLVYKHKDRYHILDYKTGKRCDWNSQERTPPVKNFPELQKDLQLIIYYMNSIKKYNTEDITVEINYVNDGGLFPLEFSNIEVEYALKKIKDIFTEVKNELPKQNITWKCKAFCDYGKKTFSSIGRSDLSMISNGKQHLTKAGEECKICEAVNTFLRQRPVELVIERCKNV